MRIRNSDNSVIQSSEIPINLYGNFSLLFHLCNPGKRQVDLVPFSNLDIMSLDLRKDWEMELISLKNDYCFI